MTKKKEEKEQSVLELIQLLPLDPDYKPINNLPIPLGRGVLVKKVEQSVIQQTESGLYLVGGNAENSNPPHLGVIYATGPQCSPYLRIGLRVYYNFYCDSAFWIGGIEYAKMDENDIFYIVRPNNLAVEKPKSARQVDREKRMNRNNIADKNIRKKEQEEKDIKDFLKGKGGRA